MTYPRAHTAASAGRPHVGTGPLADGHQWTLVRSPTVFSVRATRERYDERKLRIFDTRTRRTVLRLRNIPGSHQLPPITALEQLLQLTNPETLRSDLVSLCWLLVQTSTGFTLAARVVRPHEEKTVRSSAVCLPLPSSGIGSVAAAVLASVLNPNSTQVDPQTLESCLAYSSHR